MYLLISNDDGYSSKGINVLSDAMAAIADEVTIFAPDRNRSGASHSLTLNQTLNVKQYAENSYHVDGSPADCTHLALHGYLDKKPDMVITGINHGANLGSDVFYSGTVGAAYEAYALGIPAMAVSLVERESQYFEDAAKICRYLVQHYLSGQTSRGFFMNVNIPDLPYDKIKGFKITNLGNRDLPDAITKMAHKTKVVLGKAGTISDDIEGSDQHAVNEGYVSITPIKFDITDYAALAETKQWIEGLK